MASVSQLSAGGDGGEASMAAAARMKSGGA